MVHVAVVGAGISGLAAALRLRDRFGPQLAITLLDGAERIGGKLATGTVAGVRVEQGAESFVLRDPAAARLAERVGLGDLVHPAPVAAGIVSGDRIDPIPRGTLMGIPPDDVRSADSADAASPLGSAGCAGGDGSADGAGPAGPAGGVGSAGGVGGGGLADGRPLLAPGADVSVGALVRAEYGDRVVDRLVDPLLGGVYAGRADDLSLAVTLPALHAAAQRETSLPAAVKAAIAATPRATGPVFGAVRGGMTALVDAVAAASGATLRLGLPARELRPVPGGWELTVGATRDPQHLTADAVVLAVPARPAARLLAGVAPDAAEAIGVLDYASVALVTLVLPGNPLPDSSGFLVPAGEGFAVKAATFVTAKWPHLAVPDRSAVRLSLGRYGETGVLRRTDEDLAALARRELATILGTALPKPLGVAVRRWGGGLPQYGPGHADRVACARAALAGHPSLALAGAAYDGVGIPACVASGTVAADSVVPQGES